MPTSAFNVGDHVDRIEDRAVTGATILQIVEGLEDNLIELQYDEGGTGWWPEKCVRAKQ